MSEHESSRPSRWYPTGLLGATLRWRPFARLVTPVLRRVWPRFRYGLVVDGDGVTELRLGHEPVTWPWDEVSVETAWGYVNLKLGTQHVRFSWSAPGVVELAGDLVRRREPVVEDGPAVQTSAIEGWLGIPPDGSLVIPGRPWLLWLFGVFYGLLALLAVVAIWRGEGLLGFSMLMTWLSVTLSLAETHNSAQPVIATAEGLRQGRRRFGWDEAVSVATRYPGWLVMTSRGSVLLPECPASQRVATTIRNLAAARRAGAVLPRMADVPEHALSRAETAELAAERGLSRSEGER